MRSAISRIPYALLRSFHQGIPCLPRFHGLRIEVQRDSKRIVERHYLIGRQGADKMCQRGLRNADQLVAENAAGMLEAFVNADLDLRGEPIEGGKDRRADSSRKPGVNKGLAADNREHAKFRGSSRDPL